MSLFSELKKSLAKQEQLEKATNPKKVAPNTPKSINNKPSNSINPSNPENKNKPKTAPMKQVLADSNKDDKAIDEAVKLNLSINNPAPQITPKVMQNITPFVTEEAVAQKLLTFLQNIPNEISKNLFHSNRNNSYRYLRKIEHQSQKEGAKKTLIDQLTLPQLALLTSWFNLPNFPQKNKSTHSKASTNQQAQKAQAKSTAIENKLINAEDND